MTADLAWFDGIRFLVIAIEAFCLGCILYALTEFIPNRRTAGTLAAVGTALFVIGTTAVIWSRVGHHDIAYWYTPIFGCAATLAATGFLMSAAHRTKRRGPP